MSELKRELEDYVTYEGPRLGRGLGQALAWKLCAGLVRRHPGRDLRVVELHPGGGQYDCLAIVEGRFKQTRLLWNLGGSSLVIHGERGHQAFRWPPVALSSSPVEVVEAMLGWTPGQMRPRTATLCVAVLAELAGRYAVSDIDVELRNGWHDSSGRSGSFVREWARAIPRIAERIHALDKTGAEWQEAAAVAARLWAVVDPLDAPAVIVDVKTGAVMGPSGRERWSIADQYRAGDGVRAMAWRLEGEWRG